VDTIGISDRRLAGYGPAISTATSCMSLKFREGDAAHLPGPSPMTTRWYFAKPWPITLTAKRQKYDIMEMICTDNNQDIPHYITSKPKPANKETPGMANIRHALILWFF